MTQDEITQAVGAALTPRLQVSREQGLVVAESTLRALTSAGLMVVDMNQALKTNQLLFALARHIVEGGEMSPEVAEVVEALKGALN